MPFNDFALAYVVKGGLRVTLLDGAAFSLLFQTGKLEGGFFPDSTVLGDALIVDPSLRNLQEIDLTAGFNSYAQSAIENLVVSTDGPQGRQQLTLQLDAGHFIATSEPKSGPAQGNQQGSQAGAQGGGQGGGAHGGSAHGGGGHGGGAHGGGMSFPLDDRVENLPTKSESLPLHLSMQTLLPEGKAASTASYASAIGNGALILGDRLLVAQGNGFNGIDSNSDELIATQQQLVIDLPGLREVDRNDLLGVRSSQRRRALKQGRTDRLTGTSQPALGAEQTQERSNLASLVSLAYAGSLPTPGTLAIRAAALAKGEDPSQLVDEILGDPAAQAQVEAHFGGPLASLSVEKIVRITTQTLFGRDPNGSETRLWKQAVKAGLDRTQLPLALLQTTRGDDEYRVGLLSAASQWNALQWGHDGNVSGSFGQGFLPSENRYERLNAFALDSGRFSSWGEAQKRFDAFSKRSIDLLGGTPVSESGFF